MSVEVERGAEEVEKSAEEAERGVEEAAGRQRDVEHASVAVRSLHSKASCC